MYVSKEEFTYLITYDQEMWNKVKPLIQKATELEHLAEITDIVYETTTAVLGVEPEKFKNLGEFVELVSKDEEQEKEILSIVRFIATQALKIEDEEIQSDIFQSYQVKLLSNYHNNTLTFTVEQI